MTTPTPETTSWHEDLSAVVHEWVNPKSLFVGYGTIEDANDGSGDGILTFPEGMCETLGWKAGDTLNLCMEGEGTFILTKIS